jgi:hypothetical protein
MKTSIRKKARRLTTVAATTAMAATALAATASSAHAGQYWPPEELQSLGAPGFCLAAVKGQPVDDGHFYATTESCGQGTHRIWTVASSYPDQGGAAMVQIKNDDLNQCLQAYHHRRYGAPWIWDNDARLTSCNYKDQTQIWALTRTTAVRGWQFFSFPTKTCMGTDRGYIVNLYAESGCNPDSKRDSWK